MADPVIDLLDADSRRIGEAAEGDFEGVLRALSPGQWRFDVPQAALLLQASSTLDDVAGVRVMDGSECMFTGVVRPIPGDDFGGVTYVGTGDETRVQLAGPDAGWAALASRRAYPNPATESPWSTSHDTRSGVASTVAAGFVSANLGPTALIARQWPSVDIVDGAVGITSTWSARLQRLDRLVARICADAGIICRPTIDLDGTLRIVLAARADLSSRVVLSDQADLRNLSDRALPAVASHVIAGGRGELTSRAFAVATSSPTGRDRAEHFIDRRSLSSADELVTAANAQLESMSSSRAIRATIAAEAASQIRFLEHYDVGDVIAVERADVRYRASIESVRIVLNASEYSITPQLGNAADNAWTALVRSVDEVSAAADNEII